MRNVPRHLFVDTLPPALTRSRPRPIARQTISQPYIVHHDPTLLAGGPEKGPRGRHRIRLSDSVLAQLVDVIYSVERIEPLMKLARKPAARTRLSHRQINSRWRWG